MKYIKINSPEFNSAHWMNQMVILGRYGGK
jgi:hypothetical protein